MRLNEKLRLLVIEVLSFGGTAGIASGSLALLWRSGFSSSDVFALAGALIGAGSAVASAIWLANWQESKAHRRETDILLEAGSTLLRKTDSLLTTYPKSSWPPEWERGLIELRALMTDVPVLLEDALDRAVTLDLRERLAVRNARSAVQRFIAFYADDFNQDSPLNPCDERTWQGTLNRLSESLKEMIAEMQRP